MTTKSVVTGNPSEPTSLMKRAKADLPKSKSPVRTGSNKLRSGIMGSSRKDGSSHEKPDR